MQTRPRGSFLLLRDRLADAPLAEPSPTANPAPNSTFDEPGAHSPVVATVRDATVRLGGKAVLQRISLNVRAGEISVLLGPNGAGKTTLMRALYGGISLSTGFILIAGMDPRRERKARRRIGFVPQEVALYPRLTVRENLETFAVLAGLRRREARLRVSKVLDTAGLSEAENRLVAVLSGGMQRRVNIACGLVGAPSLLLLDEPTVGVDIEARHAVHATLRHLASASGIALLLTTHDFEEAGLLADRLLILHRGKLLADGRPRDLIESRYGSGARWVEAELLEPPSVDDADVLRGAGYEASADGLIWSSRPCSQVTGAAVLLEELGTRALRLREVRIRQPGLDAVYRDLLKVAR